MQITNQFTKWLRLTLSVTVLAGILTGCGYNDFQSKDEATKAAWAKWSTSTSAAPT
jgi:LemA protein